MILIWQYHATQVSALSEAASSLTHCSVLNFAIIQLNIKSKIFARMSARKITISHKSTENFGQLVNSQNKIWLM